MDDEEFADHYDNWVKDGVQRETKPAMLVLSDQQAAAATALDPQPLDTLVARIHHVKTCGSGVDEHIISLGPRGEERRKELFRTWQQELRAFKTSAC